MKKVFIALTTLVFLAMQSCIITSWDNGISGDGNVKSEEIDVAGFTGIHASSGIDVKIKQGDFYVELEADENLHEYITIEKVGDMLKIGSERSIHRATAKVVYVSLPELEAIRISSAGDVDAESDFVCDDLDIEISSAGDLKIGVEAEDVNISISSSGDCNIWGSAESLDAQLSSAGDLDADELIASYVKVRVSSAGDARVYASEEIDMSASSAGNIYYKGDAKVVKSSTSSAGSIIKR